ncbi:MAG: hypothetical protein JWN78_689 [Bacteroidota bacterium]|nr:hypothetical protein [Bacteroidota bacterium]
MKSFIAYFDYLGYKEFLLRNSEMRLKDRANHILRDIEMSLSQDKTKQISPGKLIADLDGVTINCLNISDTVIFWTKNDSLASCIELLNVCYLFNWKQILYNFPVRGCVIYDNFEFITGQSYNAAGAVYSPNLMYGKGLLHAHEKTDLLNWAGTVLDSSLIEKVWREEDFQTFLNEKLILYKIPYKTFYRKEYALRLVKGSLNQDMFNSYREDIIRVFESDNKSIPPSVEEKMNNTISFLEMFKE